MTALSAECLKFANLTPTNSANSPALCILSVLSLSQGVLLGAINMVSIVIAGRLIFKEKLDRIRLLGMALITLGVIFVGIYA